VAALIFVRQARVVDAQAAQDRGVQIVDGDGILVDVVRELVSRPDRGPVLDAPAGHPDRKAARVMVAAIILGGEFSLAVHGSPEFAATDDERIVQQTPLFQILNERGRRLIHLTGRGPYRFREAVVMVPRMVVGVGDLRPHDFDDPRTGFDQPASQQQALVERVAAVTIANGIGLAAQQVGAALQLTVLDVSLVEDRPSTLKLNGEEIDPVEAMPLVLLNPRIRLDEEVASGNEGCLSFPEITADIDRAVSVEVEAETLEGETLKIEASGLLARALQHEVDHLNGILFIDRMSSVTKASLSSRLKRLQKETTKVEAIKR